jgi:hypothetical protein
MPDGKTAQAQEAYGPIKDQAGLTVALNSQHAEAGGQTASTDGLTTTWDGQTVSPGGPTASSCGTGPSSSADGTSSPATMEEDTDDDLLDYEPSPAHNGMQVNVVYLSSIDYSLLEEEEVSQLALGPQDVIFKQPVESEDHLKPMYICEHLNGMLVACMLVDGGAAVNMMPYATFKKLGKTDSKHVKTNMMIMDIG